MKFSSFLALRQNLNKQSIPMQTRNSFQKIPPKKILPKNFSQKIPPKKFLPKNCSINIPPKTSSKKILKKFPKEFKNSPNKSKEIPRNFLKNSLDFENIQFPKKFKKFPKKFKKFPQQILKISKQFLKKFLRFWKYPIPYIALRGRKTLSGLFM